MYLTPDEFIAAFSELETMTYSQGPFSKAAQFLASMTNDQFLDWYAAHDKNWLKEVEEKGDK